MAYTDHCYNRISISENFFTMISQHRVQDLIYSYQIINNILPSAEILSFLVKNNSCHNTRGRQSVKIEYSRTNYLFFSLFRRLRRTWNDTPKNIKELDFIAFKNNAKRLHLSHYPHKKDCNH